MCPVVGHCSKSRPAGRTLSTLHGPLTRCVKLRVVHAPGMPGTFSPPPRVSNPDMQHSTCVTHVPWCMLGSLTSGSLLSQWRGNRSRHPRRIHNPHFYVSGKWPMGPRTAGGVPEQVTFKKEVGDRVNGLVFMLTFLWHFLWSCNTGILWTTVLWHQDTFHLATKCC